MILVLPLHCNVCCQFSYSFRSISFDLSLSIDQWYLFFHSIAMSVVNSPIPFDLSLLFVSINIIQHHQNIAKRFISYDYDSVWSYEYLKETSFFPNTCSFLIVSPKKSILFKLYSVLLSYNSFTDCKRDFYIRNIEHYFLFPFRTIQRKIFSRYFPVSLCFAQSFSLQTILLFVFSKLFHI